MRAGVLRAALAFCLGIAALAGPAPRAAAEAAQAVAPKAALERLIAALRVADTVGIMRREGVLYGMDLADGMLPEGDLHGWRRDLERIHDTGRMRRLVEAGLAEALAGSDAAPLAAFFTSALGARIVDLELGAREAFLDADVEAAARERFRGLAADGAPIVAQIETLIEDSDLVERNVAGILNANLMLWRGLADGGHELSEEDILLDVWQQEESVREDTRGWLEAYLLTAYQPLAPQERDAYIALWRTPEGRALNAALFAAYDRLYEEISYLTGRALARRMAGQQL